MATWNSNQQALDAITELVNIGVGRAASSLSELVGQRIELSIPQIRIHQGAESRLVISELCGQSETVISQAFRGTLQGQTSLCFSESSSLALAQLLSGAPHGAAELDTELSGILLEVGNIMINGVMGALSNAISAVLTYSIPELKTANGRDSRMKFDVPLDSDILIGDVRFRVRQHDIQGSIVVVFAIGAMDSLLDSMLPAAMT